MGLDRPAIRGRLGLAAALASGAAFRFTGGFSPLERVAWAAGAVAAATGVTWVAFRRRYSALAAAEEAAGRPPRPGEEALRERLVLAFFRHDPANLLLDDRNPADYAPEVRFLMGALPAARSEAQVRSAIYRHLVETFDEPPGPGDDSLHALAAEVWEIWAAHRSS